MEVFVFESCPACKSKNIKLFVDYEEFPAILFPIEKQKRYSVDSAELTSCCCDDCGHVFLNNIKKTFTDNLYKKYYYLYPYKNLESMQAPYREPFEKVADIFLSKKNGRLLEIGCDNNEQLQYFIDLGYSCTAINPGAVSKGIVHYIDGFYGEIAINEEFDCVISRFNMEHLIDLEQFFRSLDRNLKSNGLAAVQVPNAERFLDLGMLNILAHEHAHYFCSKSLTKLIERKGYKILHLSTSSSPSLICVFTKSADSYNPRASFNKSSDVLQKLRSLLIKNQNKRIFFYGSGLSLAALLYSQNFDTGIVSRAIIIDDNSMLKDRYMPNTDMKITALSEAQFCNDSLIILMLNEIYHANVIAKLKTSGITQNIYAVGSDGLSEVL